MNEARAGHRHLFVTGCSAGIGHALVELALHRGWRVSGCARSRDRLAQMERELGPRFLACPADVTRAADCHAAVAAAVERFGPLHAVAANAGRGIDGEIVECEVDDARAVFELNFFGVHRTVTAALPHLLDGGT
ncbi:MAG: SDR family NAD(P)-dependent oxidoreductase, partial [Planctomycetota bacterium]